MKPLMMHCRASHTVPMLCIAENPSRKLHLLKGKTAHRGVAARHRSASGKTRLQAARPSGKNPRRATTARQSPLLPQTDPCPGSGPTVGPASNGEYSRSDAAGNDAADFSFSLTDLALQGATKATENVRAPPNVNLRAVGVLSQAWTFLGLGISGYQTVFGSTPQSRAQAAQDTAVNAFGLRFPALAPFTTLPYDLGRLGRAGYDAYKNAQADKLFEEAAQCPKTKQ